MSLSAAVFCLALTVYHEARGEPIKGQQAVALVVMNRADWQPSKVCDVVKAKGQFPWMRKGLPKPQDKEAWAESQQLALAAIGGEIHDFTSGSTHFLGKNERPAWRSKMRYVMTIGGHRFFSSV